MDFDSNISFLTYAFWQILLIAGPILLVALVVGLAIGILQAATSINEMTLSFVPKVVIVYLALGLLGAAMAGLCGCSHGYAVRPWLGCVVQPWLCGAAIQ